MATTYDRRRPRIPEDLGQKIDAARGQQPFDAFVRRAVEAALGTPEARGTAPSRNDRPAPATSPAPPRASTERIGCERHPEAGALRGSGGRWWCAEPDCTNDAREVPA